jgi:3,4-dihydroxy 2-butanone 4-phosphate synthase
MRAGEFVVVLDDEDRENEGDLICAAELCTTEMMAWFVRHSR